MVVGACGVRVFVDRRSRRRLDYVVRSSESKPALVPVYYVKLHLAHADAGDEAPEPVGSLCRSSSSSFWGVTYQSL